MKKLFVYLLVILTIISISCSKQEVKIEGIYKYSVAFTKKVNFKDINNVTLGDTSYTFGEINLYWDLKEEPKGTNIIIEKAENTDSVYQEPIGYQLKKTDFFTDKISSSGKYYYKISIDKNLINKYSIDIPELTIYSPTTKDTAVASKNLTIYFNKIDGAQKYNITLIDYKNNPVWTLESADTQITYTGDPLQQGYVYNLIVSTEILVDSINKINISSESQFLVNKK
ncbi:MAG: hypothetical protein ABIN05_01580 [candidate division WOR-3 bacterium]